jgi:formate dehydrogenase major subunit
LGEKEIHLPVKTSRRLFLKITGGSTAAGALAGLGLGPEPRLVGAATSTVRRGKETLTICPYCATGCGFIVRTEAGKVLSVEGDPDHPVSHGGACAKGASLAQLHNNDRRLAKVLYRRPGGKEWEEKPWEWAVSEIAGRIKATRDGNWVAKDTQGATVNHTEAIASVGGASLDNEECYLLSKALRSLGLLYVEHQARL